MAHAGRQEATWATHAVFRETLVAMAFRHTGSAGLAAAPPLVLPRPPPSTLVNGGVGVGVGGAGQFKLDHYASLPAVVSTEALHTEYRALGAVLGALGDAVATLSAALVKQQAEDGGSASGLFDDIPDEFTGGCHWPGGRA